MKKKNTIYLNAIRYFENGDIDKAIKKCEEGISLDLKDGGTLNLKGLLLYLKGDLNGAIATWKINSDYNDDITAKNYIVDCKKDFNRSELYSEGERLLKNLEIDEAISTFERCRQSDFNKINVNLALAVCYFKKADYDKSSVHLTKVFEVDRKNKKAIEVSDQLNKYGGINLHIKTKAVNIFRVIAIIISLSIVLSGSYYIIKKQYNKQVVTKSTSTVEIVKKDLKDTEKVIEQQESGETKEEVLVNTETIQSAIDNKKYDDLYSLIEPLENKVLNSKEKLVYVNANQLLTSDDAINYFYQQGMGLYKKSQYDQALNSFQKVHKYGEKNYLYQHSLYFIAVINKQAGNKTNAISSFEEYFQKYKDGTYIQEVTYNLALLYKDVDLDKCKTYAEYLVQHYPDSIYNNKTISDLLEQIRNLQ